MFCMDYRRQPWTRSRDRKVEERRHSVSAERFALFVDTPRASRLSTKIITKANAGTTFVPSDLWFDAICGSTTAHCYFRSRIVSFSEADTTKRRQNGFVDRDNVGLLDDDDLDVGEPNYTLLSKIRNWPGHTFSAQVVLLFTVHSRTCLPSCFRGRHAWITSSRDDENVHLLGV